MNVLELVKSKQDEMIYLRRRLHQCPELGNVLPQTKNIIKEELTKLDVPFCDVGGGIKVFLDNKQNKTILLRADMDALPMKEESGLNFSSKGDAAHCCGHDIHSAILVTTIKVLKEIKDQLKCNVVFAFQDDEERASGCKKMVDDGLLDGVDYAFGIHVKPDYESGLINVTSGQKTGSYDLIKIEVNGKGGHGAFPELAKDPIKAACRQVLAIDDMPNRLFGLDCKCVSTMCIINGGNQANTIPDNCYIEGTIRCNSEEKRKTLKEAIQKNVDDISKDCGVTSNIIYKTEIPSLYNDPKLVDICKAELIKNLKNKVNFDYDYLSASEDFAIVSTTIPTLYYNLGTGLKKDGYLYSNHNPKVIYDESSLIYGVVAFVSSALSMK